MLKEAWNGEKGEKWGREIGAARVRLQALLSGVKNDLYDSENELQRSINTIILTLERALGDSGLFDSDEIKRAHMDGSLSPLYASIWAEFWKRHK